MAAAIVIDSDGDGDGNGSVNLPIICPSPFPCSSAHNPPDTLPYPVRQAAASAVPYAVAVPA